MMKRMFCLLLTVLMGVSCIFASAEDAQDNSADALTLAELQAFAARMQTLAMASTERSGGCQDRGRLCHRVFLRPDLCRFARDEH